MGADGKTYDDDAILKMLTEGPPDGTPDDKAREAISSRENLEHVHEEEAIFVPISLTEFFKDEVLTLPKTARVEKDFTQVQEEQEDQKEGSGLVVKRVLGEDQKKAMVMKLHLETEEVFEIYGNAGLVINRCTITSGAPGNSEAAKVRQRWKVEAVSCDGKECVKMQRSWQVDFDGNTPLKGQIMKHTKNDMPKDFNRFTDRAITPSNVSTGKKADSEGTDDKHAQRTDESSQQPQTEKVEHEEEAHKHPHMEKLVGKFKTLFHHKG